MKILIAEDDRVSRQFLCRLLEAYGTCDMTSDGIEVVEAFIMGHTLGEPYDLVCLDVMMPKIDGLSALKAIRDFERQKGLTEAQGVKVLMISTLSETEIDLEHASNRNEIYIMKPLNTMKFKSVLNSMGFRAREEVQEGSLFEDTVKAFMEASGFDLEISQSFIRDFCQQSQGLIKELQHHADQADFKAAAFLAHRLKGSAGNVRAKKIAGLALEMEEALQNADKGMINHLIGKVERSLLCLMKDDV